MSTIEGLRHLERNGPPRPNAGSAVLEAFRELMEAAIDELEAWGSCKCRIRRGEFARDGKPYEDISTTLCPIHTGGGMRETVVFDRQKGPTDEQG